MRAFGAPLLIGFLLFTTGCLSTESLYFPNHPTQATRGETIKVEFVDFYMLLMDSSVTRTELQGDTFHLALGLPKGVSVISAEFYCNPSFRPFDTMTDDSSLIAILDDSLRSGNGTKKILSIDPAFKTSLVHKDILANGKNGSIAINADSLDHWSTYSGAVNISFPAGTPVDTALYADPSSGIDSLGMIAVPIYCYLELLVGKDADIGFKNILYYAKTTGTPSVEDVYGDSLLEASGRAQYFGVRITESPSIAPRIAAAGSKPTGLHVRPSSSGVQFLVGENLAAGSLVIYSLQGAVVNRIDYSVGSASAIQWNGLDRHHKAVPTGTYIARLAKKGTNSSVRFVLNPR